jgi:hypothetical protein
MLLEIAFFFLYRAIIEIYNFHNWVSEICLFFLINVYTYITKVIHYIRYLPYYHQNLINLDSSKVQSPSFLSAPFYWPSSNRKFRNNFRNIWNFSNFFCQACDLLYYTFGISIKGNQG